MTTIEDVIFEEEIPLHIRVSILEYMDSNNLSRNTMILTPTSSNNDVDGSAHHEEMIDFTYEVPSNSQISEATTLGDYSYFSYDDYGYTGHVYQGGDNKFEALVVDPPEYAVSETIYTIRSR